jgi:glycosidase
MNRFLFLANNQVERLKLAALCQFTLAPTPIVYYGTEIGMSQGLAIEAGGGGGDSEARRDMPWDEARWNQELQAFYRDLIALRRQHHVLREGRRQTIHVDGGRNCYAYTRSRDQEITAGDLLVALNLGAESCATPLPTTTVRWWPVLSTRGGARREDNYIVLPPSTGTVWLAS